MRPARCGLLLVFVLALVSGPAAAAQWGLGSNLGMSIIFPSGGDAETAVAWSGHPAYFIPGLRLSVRTDDARQCYFLDTGFATISRETLGQTSFQGTLNAQYAFGSKRGTVPFVQAGAGVASRWVRDLGPGGQSVNPMSMVIGGAVGLQKNVAKGAGTIRAELRYDFVTEGEDLGIILIPESSVVGLRLGFDLWLP
jgi:hypothetical protein